MDLLSVMVRRRSIRKYTKEKIQEKDIEKILKAALLSASGRNLQAWNLVVLEKEEDLLHLSKCREGSATMLAGASHAIVVLGFPEISDTWIEDSSIAITNMQLMASELGIGSCWVQVRNRKTSESLSTEDYIKEYLALPTGTSVEAILSLGLPEQEVPAKDLESFDPSTSEKIMWKK